MKAKIDYHILTEIENIEWSYTNSKEHSMFVLYCENVVEAERISNLVQNLQGVKELRMDIVQDQITLHDWIQDEIEAKISGS